MIPFRFSVSNGKVRIHQTENLRKKTNRGLICKGNDSCGTSPIIFLLFYRIFTEIFLLRSWTSLLSIKRIADFKQVNMPFPCYITNCIETFDALSYIVTTNWIKQYHRYVNNSLKCGEGHSRNVSCNLFKMAF